MIVELADGEYKIIDTQRGWEHRNPDTLVSLLTIGYSLGIFHREDNGTSSFCTLWRAL
jgi:hypothetical protein